jgi:multiple sugar transport system ATP-binding protein
MRALTLGSTLRGTVRAVDNLGHELLAKVDIGGVPTPPANGRLELPERAGGLSSGGPGGEVFLRMPMPAKLARGDEVGLAVSMDDLFLFDHSGQRIRIGDG